MPTRLLRPHQSTGYGPLALVLLVGLMAWVALVLFAFRQGGEERNRLCVVLYGLIERSGATIGTKGSPGFSYYQEHPDELKTAKADNQAFLGALPCKGSTAEEKGIR